MDLCCLIDSEERLSASDLVTMLGDLLERGMIMSCNHLRTCLMLFRRDEVSCQTSPSCPNTHRQVIIRTFAWFTLWHCL